MEIFVFVVVIAAVYFFASSKSRRDAAIETRVKKMLAAVNRPGFPR